MMLWTRRVAGTERACYSLAVSARPSLTPPSSPSVHCTLLPAKGVLTASRNSLVVAQTPTWHPPSARPCMRQQCGAILIAAGSCLQLAHSRTPKTRGGLQRHKLRWKRANLRLRPSLEIAVVLLLLLMRDRWQPRVELAGELELERGQGLVVSTVMVIDSCYNGNRIPG